MTQKGLLLLILFFGLSALVTLALSIVMKPSNLAFWTFLYLFSTSQLFLFLHSTLYWYYTSLKFQTYPHVAKRSVDFDKKTLVIVSAYDEDPEVLEPTFNAAKQSFSGPVMLAVDSPRNVSSYIELCRNHDVICLHRIHRSGFKAGAINNVVLNFLRHQPEYIKKTRRVIADEIVLTLNSSSKTLPFDLLCNLENLQKTLSSLDKTIQSSYDSYLYDHISYLTSGNQIKHIHPKNLELLHSKIQYLEKKTSDVISCYNTSYVKLLSLNKIVTSIDNRIKQLSPDIEYSQLEIKSTFNQFKSMQIVQLILATEDCMKNIDIINHQKFLKFADKKDELFSIMTTIENKLDVIHTQTALLEKTDFGLDGNMQDNRVQLNYNRIVTLQTNLKTLDNMLSSLDKTIHSSYDHYIYKHISNLTSGDPTHYLQPKDLSLLRMTISTQRTKLNEIDNNVESLYEENLYDNIEQLASDKQTQFLQLDDLNLLRSKIEDLEKKLATDMQTKHLQPKDLSLLRMTISTQRTKLNEIDNNVESLYEENLYDNIEQLASDKQTQFLQLDDLNLLRSKIEDLEKDMNAFYAVTKSVTIDFLPDLEETLIKMHGNLFNHKSLVIDDEKNNLGKIEDLISEFYYTVNDLANKIPLDIDYIVLLDSDAHIKAESDPQNNFFDLAANYIEENDLVVFPQFYDKEEGPLVRAAYAQQVPFMKTIMPKRGEDNTAFMLGTNIILKKNTLESVNGFDDSTVTEDLATTMKIHESHGKSKYVNKDVVVNGAPLSITGYFTQQQRWAFGTYQVFLHMLLHGVGRDLNLKRYIEYLYGNTWYFYGLTFLINALIPFYSIFWEGLIQIPENLFYTLYLPYVFSGIIIFFYSVLRTGHGFKDVFYNMSLNAICFFVYIKALFFILRGKKLPFEVTPKSGTSGETFLRYKKISPILIVMGLLGFSSAVYVIRIITGESSLVPGLINVIWGLFFISLLSPILRFK